MNYAISSPNMETTIRNTISTADLVSKLIAAFVAGGWLVHASITGGSTLLGVSPQGYQVYCDVWESDADTASIQLHSAVGSGCTGFPNALHWDVVNGPSYLWSVITHPCGFFIAQPQYTSTVFGTCCMGGIPMLPTNCGLSTALGTVTECWFGFGDYVGDPFAYAGNPRTNLEVTTPSNVVGSQSSCFNGVSGVTGNASNKWDIPEILRFSSAAPDTGSNSQPLFFGETPMTYPAFIAWPATTGGVSIEIRGQIYNAAVISAPSGKGTTGFFDGFTWVSYTDNYFFGTLWVLTGSGITPAALPLQNVQF